VKRATYHAHPNLTGPKKFETDITAVFSRLLDIVNCKLDMDAYVLCMLNAQINNHLPLVQILHANVFIYFFKKHSECIKNE